MPPPATKRRTQTHRATRCRGRTNTLYLVTCGSPLQSLYAQFFPTKVDPELFTTVRGSTQAWTNYWRVTDPIASPIPGMPDAPPIASRPPYVNWWIPDPRSAGEQPRKHSDYWLDQEQWDYIAERLRPASEALPLG